MFDNLRQLFVLDFQGSFWVAKVVHLQFNLIPSCQTLSNAFDVSKKTPLTPTVGFSSKAVSISRIIDNNWAIHESTGRNPDLEGVKSLLLWK